MKLKMLLMATCLLLPMSSAFAETVDEYVAGLKKRSFYWQHRSSERTR